MCFREETSTICGGAELAHERCNIRILGHDERAGVARDVKESRSAGGCRARSRPLVHSAQGGRQPIQVCTVRAFCIGAKRSRRFRLEGHMRLRSWHGLLILMAGALAHPAAGSK